MKFFPLGAKGLLSETDLLLVLFKEMPELSTLCDALYFQINVSIMASLSRVVTTLGARSTFRKSLQTTSAYSTHPFTGPKTCDINTVETVTHTGQVNIYLFLNQRV